MKLNHTPFGGFPFGDGFGPGPDPEDREDREPERFNSDGRPVRSGSFGKKAGALLLVLFVLLTAKNSFYILDEDNYAVVTTLGSAKSVSQAGLHFKIPYIQHVFKVSKEIIGMPIGYVMGSGETIDEESIMITKDFNFVNTDFYLDCYLSPFCPFCS